MKIEITKKLPDYLHELLDIAIISLIEAYFNDEKVFLQMKYFRMTRELLKVNDTELYKKIEKDTRIKYGLSMAGAVSHYFLKRMDEDEKGYYSFGVENSNKLDAITGLRRFNLGYSLRSMCDEDEMNNPLKMEKYNSYIREFKDFLKNLFKNTPETWYQVAKEPYLHIHYYRDVQKWLKEKNI